MHRIAGTVIIFIITSVIAVCGFFINTKTSDSIQKKVQAAVSSSRQNDIVLARKQVGNAVDEWNEKKELMLLFVSHGKLDQIDESMNIACSYIETGDTNLFITECVRIQVLLQHFNDLEYPSINNIF